MPDPIRFGTDGWRAVIAEADRRRCRLEALEQTRPQASPPDLELAIALVKRARLETIVERELQLDRDAWVVVVVSGTDGVSKPLWPMNRRLRSVISVPSLRLRHAPSPSLMSRTVSSPLAPCSVMPDALATVTPRASL